MPPLIGRESPLRALRDALRAPPALFLLSGEAGIGKTRLVTEVEASGCLVLHGDCLEFGGEAIAYAPVAAALRGLPQDWLDAHLAATTGEAARALAAVLPREIAGAGAPAAQLHELLLDLLGRLADAHGPVLLVLEDIQWADRSTLALLAFLARNLRDERLVALATLRVDDELAPAVRRLASELSRRERVHRIDLDPLTPEDVARQLAALAGERVPARFAHELHARAGGNPFFVEELYAARTTTLTEAVLTRVERLDDATLAVMAAIGGRASHELLERLGVAPDALRAGLDAGVFVRVPDGVAFRHGLIGEVVYERLFPAERAALHRSIADALQDPAQRAHHCQRAGLRAEALAASMDAGIEAARMHAHAEAHVHFERALELADDSVDRVDLLSRAAQAARFSGDPERAVALCREALGLERDPPRRAALYERLGEFHFWDDQAALDCYERALELQPGAPRLLAAKGHALMGLRRWEESRACCEAALSAGAAPRITLGVVLTFLGEPDAGEAHLREALALSVSGEETARAFLHLGELLRVRGDHAGALQAMIDGEREAAQLGLRGSFGHFMFVNGADDLFRLGRWDEAAARLETAATMELSRTAAALRRATAVQLCVARGRLDAARKELEPAEHELPAEFAAPLAAARASLALAEGEFGSAAEHVAGAMGGVEDPFYTSPLYSLAVHVEAERAEDARARRRAADPARAHWLLDALDALVEGAISPDAHAHRALARAELTRVEGRAAPERWQEAAAAFDALAEPYPAALARLQEAEATLIAGADRSRAAPVLAAVRATAARLGAAPLLEAVDALARRARLALADAPPPSAPEDGGAGLTEREAEVLALLSEGLTNREIAARLFISVKTVGAHMAHIYDKLGVHSRVEAANRARRLGV
jgi:DNA-binding CsgD family transcriptional regulator